MNGILQDLRYAARTLVRSPAFTAAAVLALGLGIGATTAIFNLVHAVLLEQLPYDEPERIAMVWEKRVRENVFDNVVSPADFIDWRARNRVFDFMAAHQNFGADLIGRGEPEKLEAGLVTADFFKVLGVKPQLGRLFEPGDDTEGRDAVVVITHGLWQRRFGGDPAVIGTKLNLGGREREVIGVLSASFRHPKAEELWLPFTFPAEFKFVREAHFLEVYARMKRGVGLAEARAAMDVLASAMQKEYPEANRNHGTHVVGLREQLVAGPRPMLTALLAAVGFTVLIACANVANLLLARGAARQREISVRSALGASRARLVRLLLLESALLSAAAAALGVVLAVWGVDLLKLLIPADAPILKLRELTFSGPVLAFAVALSLLSTMLSGLVPALQSTRVELQEGLKDGGRTTSGPGRRRLRSGLVMAEVALSLILLTGAGLMIRTLVRLMDVSPGFEKEHVLSVKLELPRQRYPKPERVAAFYESMLERLRGLPGVRAAGAISQLPLSGNDARSGVTVEGREPRLDEPTRMHHRIVTPGYFETLQIPLKAGRLPDRGDSAGGAPVLLVNETAARRYWGSASPVGKRVQLGGTPVWREVIGVVGDVKHWGLDSDARPEMYLPFAQSPSPFMALVVRGSGDPMALAGSLREEVRSLDADLPMPAPLAMGTVVEASVAPRRFFLNLMGAFAALALTLAAVGIYAVMAYNVAQRTHEIGVRLSLGARRADIQKLVLGEGLRVAAAGVGIGVPASIVLGRFIREQLFGVASTDPGTLFAVSAVLLASALLACAVPARRATRVDPVVALRCD